MNVELQKVERIIRRAEQEGKAVDDVVYGMRLDWLAGIFFAGNDAIYDSEIYDKKAAFGREFDIFTYDIGHGKGHGHRDSYGSSGSSGYGGRQAAPARDYETRATGATRYSKPEAPQYERPAAPAPVYEEPKEEAPQPTYRRRAPTRQRRPARRGGYR